MIADCSFHPQLPVAHGEEGVSQRDATYFRLLAVHVMVHMSTLTEESCGKVRFLAMSVLFAHCTEPCPERGFISRLEKSSTMTVMKAPMVFCERLPRIL